jgi:hypothetical protein
LHYFHKSLAAGKSGEVALQKLAAKNGVVLTATDGRKGDLTDADGNIWEVKCDSYDMNSTANLFIEWWSDLDKLKPGGPLQARLHGCKYFVYYFSKNNTAFVYDLEQLCNTLEAPGFALGKPVYVKNIRWITVGYKVNRALLTPIAVWSKNEL